MNTRKAYTKENYQLKRIEEDHYNDVKSARIQPKKLQETFVAFANADGGDLYIGIEDKSHRGERIIGFSSKEDANDILHTLLQETKPSVENVEIEFIDFNLKGYVLHLSIPKSPKVHYCSDGSCYLRVNAQKTKIKGEKIAHLGYAKGSFVYEKQPVDIVDIEDYENGDELKSYMSRVKTSIEPSTFLKKQRLLTKKESTLKPNVACVLMFDEEPQATLDTRCAIKVYRLLTSEEGYKRELLKEVPRTINGPIEKQIKDSINAVHDLLKDASAVIDGKLQKIKYPEKTIHEILVNAVIHRDYSLNDDIHIRVYDNRIEIITPGKLPGYITLGNIYEERFSRNPNIVRMLHNLPDPLNHDIGEGLDTARNEMKRAGLIAPIIQELDNSVKVTIKHKKLASIEDIILSYFKENKGQFLTNKKVRELSGEDDVNKVKKAFQKLRKLGEIEPVDPAANAFDFKYKKKDNS